MADINDLANEVANLTTATTNLVNEVVGQKERLEDLNTQAQAQATLATTKAGEAATSAGAAASSASAANTSKSGAAAEADRAELAASQATQITGLETVEQAVTQALADGGYTWRTEADMQHERAINNAMFAASGFAYFGHALFTTAPNYRTPINEGLFTLEHIPNRLGMGVTSTATNAVGNSKTIYPVVNMAGFTTDLFWTNAGAGSYDPQMGIKFPEAEAGTRVYDSATGVSIDYAKEVDPKYGDIAPDHNEAVARAHEGIIENGDIRLGVTRWAEVLVSKSVVDGALRVTAAANTQGHRIAQRNNTNVLPMQSGVTYVVECHVRKGTYEKINFQYDCDQNLNAVADYPRVTVPLKEGYNKFVITPAYTGEESWAGYGFQGSNPVPDQENYFDVGFLYVRPITTEVVTNRVDMFGFEGFLEQITPTNPFVYKHGLIQSQSTDIDGIATTASNRPDTYYAVYDGDTTSKGKGVNFLALSVIEQDLIASNPKNHIYRMANGDIVQWRIRQRTIAGAGNGEWYNIDPNRTDYMGDSRRFANFRANKDSSSFLMAQGKFNLPNGNHATASKRVSLANNWVGCGYGGRQDGGLTDGSIYKLVVSSTDGIAYNGECYFLVCGTVSRLNQGIYHPNLNVLGTGKIRQLDSSTPMWYGWSSETNQTVSQKDMFVLASTTVIGKHGAYGAIANASSGRPDGRYYDAIYAGQVHDMRMSAWGVTDYSKALTNAVRKDVAGKTRGKSSVPFTAIVPVDDVDLIRYGSGQQLRTTTNANDTDLTRNPQLTRALLDYVGSTSLGNFTAILTNTLGITGINSVLSSGFSSYLCFDVEGESNTRVYRILGVPYGTDVCSVVAIGSTPDIEASVTPVSGSTFIMWCLGDHMGNQYAPINTLLKSKLQGKFNSLPWVDIYALPDAFADVFPEGFRGQWVGGHNLQDVTKGIPLARKTTQDTIDWVYYKPDLGYWQANTRPVNVVLNTITSGAHAGLDDVHLHYYETLSDFTEPDTNSAVVGDLGDVIYTGRDRVINGNRLHSSLIGTVGKWNQSVGNRHVSIDSYELWENDTLATSVPLSHTPINYEAPQNESDSVKTLPHLVEKNDQLFVQYHATQLVHNGTDWGDDSLITIVDNESTKTDLNGSTVKVVTHTSQYPIGWVKNEI